MICVLKHKKSGRYLTHAIGKLRQLGHSLVWNRDKETVQFKLTRNISQAKLIEDPDMNMVLAYGLKAIPVKITKAKIEQDYEIIEHDKISV